MKIIRVGISNWRSVKNLEFEANDLMIIIGQNNHGKSNLLSALLFFFGEIKSDYQDFYFGTKDLFVEITFNDLDETDKVTFSKYLTDEGTIKVRKSSNINGQFEYRGYIQIPTLAWLDSNNAADYSQKDSMVPIELKPYLSSPGRVSKARIIDAQNKYIKENRENIKLRYLLESTQFMGYKNVAKGIFGNVYYIPAIKDAGDEYTTKDSSIFGKLYSELISEMTQNDEHVKKAQAGLDQIFNTFNRKSPDGTTNQNRPKELINIESELNSFLAPWDSDLEIEFKGLNIENICKAHTQIWIHDGVKTDIGRKGHGLQRALIISLVKLIAKKKREKNQTRTTNTVTKSASRSGYFLIEEPELYLHPQAQRELFDSLVCLTESGNQVIASTHSSSLIDLQKFKSIYIATKDHKTDGTILKYCKDNIFSDNEEKNLFKLAHWINPDRGELFFAKKVVLIEGATEKTIIPYLAKSHNLFSYDISLVECGSKTAMAPYIKLLNKFSIPYTVVYDKDLHESKNEKALQSARIATSRIESAINPELGQSIVLENDIEEELNLPKSGGTKPFSALNHIKTETFNLSPTLKAKIENVYRKPA